MIHFRQGDMFSEGADGLVNPVNCIGVSGAGLALEFKKRYPDAYRKYREACLLGRVKLGEVYKVDRTRSFYGDPHAHPRYVYYFPTKDHFRDRSLPEDIAKAMPSLADSIGHSDCLKSVCVPALGCGLGGADWREVKSIIEEGLAGIANYVEIYVFEPLGC